MQHNITKINQLFTLIVDILVAEIDIINQTSDITSKEVINNIKVKKQMIDNLNKLVDTSLKIHNLNQIINPKPTKDIEDRNKNIDIIKNFIAKYKELSD